MKKLFLIGASLFGILAAQTGFSMGFGGFGGSNCCAPSCPSPCCDQPTNECYCRYVRYQPCYFNTTRCIEEQIPYTRKCCRQVPRYYQVQRCRYISVPQYYTETCCRPECEFYDVQECRTCKRYVCEPQCTYKPVYYWKHTCGDNCAPNCSAPSCGPSCAPNCCP